MVDSNEKSLLAEGLKVAAELLIVPGSSLLAQSNFKSGLIHAGVGLVAKLAFGAPAVLLTAANSYHTARTGESLLSRVLGAKSSGCAAGADGDPRDVSLRRKVYGETAQGVSLDVIKEGVAEDVEDLYNEAIAEQKTASESGTHSGG